MPRKTVWTDGQDNQIRRLRTEGASWDAVALALGLARSTVIDHARAIGAEDMPPNANASLDESGRDPMQAGDPASWDAINRGTGLENAPFRLPGSLR